MGPLICYRYTVNGIMVISDLKAGNAQAVLSLRVVIYLLTKMNLNRAICFRRRHRCWFL